jgi:CheY-like chemotaxis protein
MGTGALMPRRRRKAVAATRKARRRTRPSARAPRAIEFALAGLAHDIRTPLTGILALADLLATADLPDREQQWAAAIKDASEHLARLTTFVVDAARAETAGLALRSEAFSPRQLAQSVAASLGARAAAKGLKTRAAIAPDLPARALGDEVRLRSALENLIDNAVKFTERGTIGFDVAVGRARGGRIRIDFVVTDSGMGITAADRKKLFRPFAQANAEVARRYGGAGLGLAFVRRIAEAMGGSLTVTSRRGQGSRFRLRVLVAPVGAAAAAGTSAVTGDRTPLRVLCVEDNPYGRIVLKAMLTELGHRVMFVGSGEAAVAAVIRGGHDAVLMDVALPGIDGIEATRRIRALPGAARRIPIIGVSGGEQTPAAGKAAGMNACLRKPALPAELDEALREATAVTSGE